MEIFTDFLAIWGWAALGFTIPFTKLYEFNSVEDFNKISVVLFLSFGLIAASLVLG